MNFFTFAFYFFICQTVYDVISSLVRSYMLKKEFEKIREQLVEDKNIWN
jgi:hypothetical protein